MLCLQSLNTLYHIFISQLAQMEVQRIWMLILQKISTEKLGNEPKQIQNTRKKGFISYHIDWGKDNKLLKEGGIYAKAGKPYLV